MGKYLIAFSLTILVFLIILLRRNTIRLRTNVKIFWYIISGTTFCYFILFAIYSIKYPGYYNLQELVKAIFFIPIILAIPIFYKGYDSIKLYLRYSFIFVLFHLIYSTIQLVAYIWFDRLPALAYRGVIARFGGGWDDPNGFGMFLILPILFFIAFVNGFKYKKSIYLLITILLALLAITFSLTAIASFLAALIFLALLTNSKKIFFSLALLFTTTTVAILTNEHLQDLLAFLYKLKSKSIHTHLSAYQSPLFSEDMSIPTILVGDFSRGVFIESFYLHFFFNFGILGITPIIFIILITLFQGIKKMRYFKLQQNYLFYKLLAVFTSYIFAFSFGAMNLPYFSIFPVNVYFWIIVVLVWLNDQRSNYSGILQSSSSP